MKLFMNGAGVVAQLFESYYHLIHEDKSLQDNVYNFLSVLGHEETAIHCIKVAEEARNIAIKYSVNGDAAYCAGLLHDISAIYPNHLRIDVAKQLQIEVLREEEIFPMIIHQKISKVMAREIFHIRDEHVLQAIECHTTLKQNATSLDKVVFVADKIAWDQKGSPPYIHHLTHAMQLSLDHAAFAYINYLWERRETLKVIHPWLEHAYHELAALIHYK